MKPVRTVSRVLLALGAIVLASLAPAAEAPSLGKASAGVVKERRLALVIGNAAYRDAPLVNSINDARDIARALADSSFEVTRLENASLREMRLAVREFGDRLRDQGGVGLFYFAGHGVQVRGRNYLIPIGADIEREDEVEFESLDANLVLEKLDSAGNRFNIVILDACRNNPFARAYRSATQGLAQMDAPSGTVVAFSTAPGSVASDGPGRNGLYTQHLVEGIDRQGLKLEEVFKQVRAEVRRDSSGKQTPWESTSLEGDFYFHPIDLAALEAARRAQEQVRLDAAIKVAIANERERILKEIEEARRGQVGPSASPPVTIAANDSLLEPQESLASTASPSAEPLPSESKTIVASIVPPSPPRPSQETANASGVIGTEVRGKIEAPRFEVGEEWVLLTLVTNPSDRAANPTPELRRFTASDVTASQLMLENVKLDLSNAEPAETKRTYSVSRGLETGFANGSGFGGNYKFLAFPLEIGARWSYSYEYGPRAARRRDDMDCTVVGWEEVTVPAGKFIALKIEQWGWWNVLGNRVGWEAVNSSGRKHLTLWYSPTAKYIVKSIAQTYSPAYVSAPISNVTSTELVRFSGLPKQPDPMTGVLR